MYKTFIFQSLLVLLIFMSSNFAYGQTIIKGTINNKADNSIVPYVNVGIKQKGIGTAANAHGDFSLNLGLGFLEDTLTFSAIGYHEYSLPVKFIVEAGIHEFLLSEKVNILQEVRVTSKQIKTRRLGVTSKMPFIMGNAETKGSDDISELAQLVEVNGKASELVSTTVFLKSTKADSATFRINFYKNNNGAPAQRIVEKSVIKRLPLNKGWVSVDLEEYKIILDEDFFLGLEYLPDNTSNEKFLFFYGAVFGGHIYSRNVSLDSWKKTLGGRISAYVTVRQVK